MTTPYEEDARLPRRRAKVWVAVVVVAALALAAVFVVPWWVRATRGHVGLIKALDGVGAPPDNRLVAKDAFGDWACFETCSNEEYRFDMPGDPLPPTMIGAWVQQLQAAGWSERSAGLWRKGRVVLYATYRVPEDGQARPEDTTDVDVVLEAHYVRDKGWVEQTPKKDAYTSFGAQRPISGLS